MAAVEITISGVLYDKLGRTTRPVVLIGEASLTGLGVGGGPMPPGDGPPGIWGPTDPRPGYGLPGQQPPIGAHPEHPIYYPPGIWGPNDPRPGWGLPKPPDGPPENATEPKPPPDGGGWGWHPEYGWGYFPMGGGKPQPGR